ncbi:MAG: SRPBCC family protein [Frankiaceae bacterium]
MVALARSLSEQITIAAHPKAIMAVIEDLDRLPQWVHPMKRVQIHERFPDERPKLVHFWVMTPFLRDDFLLEFEWEGDHRVSWRQVAGRLLREQVGSYTLTDVGEHTQVRYDLAVLMKLPIPGFIQRLGTEIIMAHALSGLKAQVEQASR